MSTPSLSPSRSGSIALSCVVLSNNESTSPPMKYCKYCTSSTSHTQSPFVSPRTSEHDSSRRRRRRCCCWRIADRASRCAATASRLSNADSESVAFPALANCRRRDAVTTRRSAPATMVVPSVVSTSSFILTMSPVMSTSPTAMASKVTVATVKSPRVPQFDDGDRPQEPTSSTSLVGSFVVHEKLLPQLLP